MVHERAAEYPLELECAGTGRPALISSESELRSTGTLSMTGWHKHPHVISPPVPVEVPKSKNVSARQSYNSVN